MLIPQYPVLVLKLYRFARFHLTRYFRFPKISIIRGLPVLLLLLLLSSQYNVCKVADQAALGAKSKEDESQFCNSSKGDSLIHCCNLATCSKHNNFFVCALLFSYFLAHYSCNNSMCKQSLKSWLKQARYQIICYFFLQVSSTVMPEEGEKILRGPVVAVGGDDMPCPGWN